MVWTLEMAGFPTDMNSELNRYGTFHRFQAPDGVWALQLARAGFYVCSDRTMACFACQLMVDVENVCAGSALKLHSHLSPQCSFVLGASRNKPVNCVDCTQPIGLLQQQEGKVFLASTATWQRPTADQTPTSAPEDRSFYSHTTLMTADLTDLNSPGQLDRLDPPMQGDRLDLNGDGRAASRALSETGFPGLQQSEMSFAELSAHAVDRLFGSLANGLCTDGVSTGHHGEYPDPLMEQIEGLQWLREVERQTQNVQQAPHTAPPVDGAEEQVAADTPVTLTDLGVFTERPKYTLYSSIQQRIDTFIGWTGPQSSDSLAGAGFFYTGEGDSCWCFYCGGGLKCWEPEDDPWVEHARCFKSCPFVLITKGQEFINCVQALAATSKQVLLSDVVEEMKKRQGRSASSSEDDDLESVSNPDEAEDDDNSEETEASQEHFYERVKRLMAENEKLKRRKQCKICMDADVGIIFLPCGHLVSCGACAPAMRECPMCRKIIEATARVQL